MSEAAPAAEVEEMDGESTKEDEPEVAAVPNSPGEKGTRAKSGQSETPTTGGRVQSRRGLMLAEKILDADAPASVQAVEIARKIKANAMLDKLCMGYPIASKDQGVTKITVQVDDGDERDHIELTKAFAVAREGLAGMVGMWIVPKTRPVGVLITMMRSLLDTAMDIDKALLAWSEELKGIEDMEETIKDYEDMRNLPYAPRYPVRPDARGWELTSSQRASNALVKQRMCAGPVS